MSLQSSFRVICTHSQRGGPPYIRHDDIVQEIKAFSALTRFDQSGTLDNEGGLR
jgi:hypothetical protein